MEDQPTPNESESLDSSNSSPTFTYERGPNHQSTQYTYSGSEIAGTFNTHSYGSGGNSEGTVLKNYVWDMNDHPQIEPIDGAAD